MSASRAMGSMNRPLSVWKSARYSKSSGSGRLAAAAEGTSVFPDSGGFWGLPPMPKRKKAATRMAENRAKSTRTIILRQPGAEFKIIIKIKGLIGNQKVDLGHGSGG